MSDHQDDLATRRFGDGRVTALLCGSISASFGLLQGLGEEDAKAILVSAGRPAEPTINVYAYLVTLPGRTILIDGGLASANGGQLETRLAQAGCHAGSIDTILLTHAHSDHVGGLVAADGTAVFGQADVVVAGSELAFWSSDEHRDAMPDARRASFEGARRFFDSYRSRVRTAEEGEVAPGIALVPLPGHTPGHCGFRLGVGADAVLVWGDIVHFPTIQMARPEVTVAFDVDPATAKATRERLLGEVAEHRTEIAGMHLDQPGFMRVGRVGDGYAVAP